MHDNNNLEKEVIIIYDGVIFDKKNLERKDIPINTIILPLNKDNNIVFYGLKNKTLQEKFNKKYSNISEIINDAFKYFEANKMFVYIPNSEWIYQTDILKKQFKVREYIERD
ncbi:MAG: hypothetical protein QXK76_03575 [Candidatus Woesearchaeota archaeon]